MIRLGIVGCGVMGRMHLTAAKTVPDISVTAVCDIDEAAARALADEFQVPNVFTDLDPMLSEVDAVVLAMPACARTALALTAFAADVHVLTEKPVAMNAREVRDMQEAQGDRTGACCSSRFQTRESFTATRDFIRTGALGDIRVVRCRILEPAGAPPTSPPPAWRLNRSLNGGGIMSNWGCYDLDYLLSIMDWALRPIAVRAKTWTVPPMYADYVAPGSDAETHVAATIHCDGDIVLELERGEYVPCAPEQSWQIIGSRGTLDLTMTPAPDKSITFYTRDGDAIKETCVWSGNESFAGIEADILADFAAAIQDRRQPMTCLGRAHVIQSLTDAIYESSETNKTVML